MVRKAVLAGIIFTMMIQSAIAAPLAAESVENEIAKLTREIDTSRNDIGSLDSQLEATTKDIILTYQKLDAQEATLKQQKRALNLRLGEIYKNYDELMIGVFLDARSFTDMWKRFAFLAKINASDTALLAANKLRLDQVRHLKQQLARKKQEQIDLKRRKQNEYLSMQGSLLEKKALLETRLREAQAAAAAQLQPVASAVPAPPIALPPQPAAP